MRYLPILLFLPLVLFLVRLVLRRRNTIREWSAHLQQEHTLVNPLGLIGPCVQPFNLISAADAFDPTFAPLWETQIPALQLICAAGGGGIHVDALRPIYLRSSQSFPELYELTGFEAWLNFLEQEQLICVGENRVKITAGGLEFLRCQVTTQVAV